MPAASAQPRPAPAATGGTQNSRRPPRRQQPAPPPPPPPPLTSFLAAAALAAAAILATPSPPPALAAPSLESSDPVEAFLLRGRVAKKYTIDELEQATRGEEGGGQGAPSTRVTARRPGFTAAACVLAGADPGDGAVGAALAGVAGGGPGQRPLVGAPASPPPTLPGGPAPSCARAESTAMRPACVPACKGACAAGVAARAAADKARTGFRMSLEEERRLTLKCARACVAECERPSTSGRPYFFDVRFGR